MKQQRMNVSWIILGAVLLAGLLVVSLYPQLLTAQKPNHVDYANYATGQTAPYPPSPVHPFGTDQYGQDLLARTLAGTLNTLLPALSITVIVVFVSMIFSTLAVSSERSIISKSIQSIGNIMSALPALLLLMLVMNHRNMSSPYQEVQYTLWIALFEIGRGAYAFYESMDKWFGMDFVDGAVMIGRSRLGILFTHLRSWLVMFLLEFAFSELARVLSIMTMLAAFHIYAVEKMSSIPFFISFPPILGIQSAQDSWVAIIGDATNNGAFISYPYFLYGPFLALLIAMLGANFIARGFRGRAILAGSGQSILSHSSL
ncbi:MAG: hypothetical protein A2201_04640 [Alicyclobacillus sp. RIFOXYA1_FULL_53_8]|nr:MAG: hypothetical protein A2201_04640 [Alicyclobacillus sp. RIFOXYA1_FULL_53_8]